ncbi:MAG TPA: tripartite tricarboxylate transporter substrate binding protein [Xanthobacteraceae bacterium]|jgi:tripartite-type tricarboxylate transporter receptor subunit TctC|nr:tripartite tricarboxylate transporter substrate binding protein [Xanthobacteraceae bacterium]
MMKLPRRDFLKVACAAAATSALLPPALALDYPTRPVRFVVGFPPGGQQDIMARLIGQWLSERLGQQFLVENRSGAGGNIAAEAVINSPPDGYTMLLVGSPNAINATLYEKLNFVFLRDIAPVGSFARTPLVMEVHPSVPATTVPEFIAYAKANPGKINYASAGMGTPQHVSAELLKILTGINIVHVPYRGSAPALVDMLAGQVQAMIDPLPASIEFVRSGRLRPLAVTSAARWPALPNLPTVAEFVPGYLAESWYGAGVPRNTPAEIVDRLNREINAGLANARIAARIVELGATVQSGSPADFGQMIAEEIEKWGKVVKASGAKVE